MKRTLVILILMSLLLLAGCPAIQMRADHERTFRLMAINVAELNKRCQGGDGQACKEGLDVAAQSMQTVIEAMNGEGE